MDDAVLRDDDHAIANVIAIAVGLLDAVRVDESYLIANPRVLVHNHAIELRVASDSETRAVAARRRLVVGFVEIGAKQHGPPNGGTLEHVRANADDRLRDRRSIEIGPFRDDRIANT